VQPFYQCEVDHQHRILRHPEVVLGIPSPATQARSKQREAAEGRIESGIPLPPSTDAHDAAVMADLAARAGVGPAALPSCAFATFVNTGQTLNCAAFAPDASTVAGVCSSRCGRCMSRRSACGWRSTPDAMLCWMPSSCHT